MKRKKTFCENFLNFRIYLTKIDKAFYRNLLKEKEVYIIDKNIDEKKYDYLKFSKILFEFDNILKYLPQKEDNKSIEKAQITDKEEPFDQVEFLFYTIKLKDTLEKIIRK